MQQRRANLDGHRGARACASTRTGSSDRTRSRRSCDAHERAARTTSSRPTRPETTSGRILGIRTFGKATFLVLSDGRAQIQVYVAPGRAAGADFEIFKLLDFGD